MWLSRTGSLLCLCVICTQGSEWTGLSICLLALVCVLLLPTEVWAPWPKAGGVCQAAVTCRALVHISHLAVTGI